MADKGEDKEVDEMLAEVQRMELQAQYNTIEQYALCSCWLVSSWTTASVVHGLFNLTPSCLGRARCMHRKLDFWLKESNGPNHVKSLFYK